MGWAVTRSPNLGLCRCRSLSPDEFFLLLLVPSRKQPKLVYLLGADDVPQADIPADAVVIYQVRLGEVQLAGGQCVPTAMMWEEAMTPRWSTRALVDAFMYLESRFPSCTVSVV